MRILFICPNWASLATPVLSEMKRQGHDVVHLDHKDFSSFSYDNSAHRMLSKAYQLICKKNYKHVRTKEQVSRTIDSFFIAREPFDAIIMTEPNLFERSQLEELKKHTRYLVATLWDSLTKSPDNGYDLDLFDYKFSYDEEDCKNHNLLKINNYLDASWQSNKAYDKCEYDAFAIMSFTKERYKKVVAFLDANPQITPDILFYIDNKRKRKYITDKRIKVVEKLLLGDELSERLESSKAFLDILQGHQTGLSFRAYEAMGYKRKLITNNDSIKGYDFYNSDNIAIVGEDLRLPGEFFSSEYNEIPESITQGYTVSSWVSHVLGKLN
ncbi:hypothetical protein L3Q72_00760 [Vibrio sp. JC009]|uniref:hypothetical protein n=1 Tax=Vibrio sp. JC009 TaxID=2912314 RepID=UPI0023AFDE78|nr:hypothetical protein [Vibrio sp. JC009]WED21980.1 hypothetical protein L3Q72_00760 [Vibrio sp. JC009]